MYMYLIIFCNIVFLKNISLIFLSPTKQMLNISRKFRLNYCKVPDISNRDASVVGVGSIQEF